MTQAISARLIRPLVTFLTVSAISAPALSQSVILPKGQACADFAVSLEIIPPPNRVDRTFYDRSGNPIRFLHAGAGNELVFTNLATGTTLTYKTGGSVEHITPNPDGTQTWDTTGHEGLILFPSDTPPGPSSTLYIGHLVFVVRPSNFELLGIQSFSGKAIDICAALAG